MTQMDLSKHAGIFDPTTVQRDDTRIAVIGLGAVGSAVALNLAKLGLTNMTLYDFDRVEPHNLPNQVLYGPDDVGAFKATAASARIRQLTGYLPNIAQAKITADARPDDAVYIHLRAVPEPIVFCCVDTMAARDYIFRYGRRMVARYWGDGRMNARDIAAYGFDPSDRKQAKVYESTLYPDSEVDDTHGGCAVTPSIGATAWTLACHMAWQFIQHTAGAEYDNEILTRADRPLGTVTRQFERTVSRRNAA